MPHTVDRAPRRRSSRRTTTLETALVARAAALDDPADLFGQQSYLRGGMTLEALRQKVGSHDFFVILRSWAKQHKYGNVRRPSSSGSLEGCLDKT